MSPLLFELYRWWFAIRYEAVQRDKREGNPNSVCVLFFVKRKEKKRRAMLYFHVSPLL
jgi:hypothetical protein